MKLRNKKTGEIVDLLEIVRIDDVSNEFYLRLSDNEGRTFKVGFNSLTELNEEWKDAEELKEYWYVSCTGRIEKATSNEDDYNENPIAGHKEIGNYFETEEEAEKAVEKLKAFKRLKDKGFRFITYDLPSGSVFNIEMRAACEKGYYIDIMDELDLLFGGEE